MSTVLRADRPHAPSVTLTCDGLVRKSYDNCPMWLRQSVGRLAIGREWWALNRLVDSPHAPRVVSRPNPWTLVTEYVDGVSLEKLDKRHVDAEKLLEQARSLLQHLQSAGIAHADLGHDHWQSFGRECNLIWSTEETLVAIDFAGAFPLAGRFPLGASLGRLMRLHDRLLESKIVFHFGTPERVEAAPQARWSPGTWEALRFLGKI